MKIREVKGQARKALSGKWGTDVLASLVTGVIYSKVFYTVGSRLARCPGGVLGISD